MAKSKKKDGGLSPLFLAVGAGVGILVILYFILWM
jgi:hypothetical protein